MELIQLSNPKLSRDSTLEISEELFDQLQSLCQSSSIDITTPLRLELKKIAGMVHRGRKPELILRAMAIAIEHEQPNLEYVREAMFRIVNKETARFSHCTAGQSVIELTADGNYSRCLRYAAQKRFIGNLFEDQQIKLLDLDTQSDCDVACKKRMCHARNTIRSSSRKDFDETLAEKGIKGDYGTHVGRVFLPDAKRCIRWRITETCNYRCSYCSAWKTVNQKLPEIQGNRLLEAAKIILDQFDGVWLRITGGEPSVVRNYVELMKYLNSRLDRIEQIEIRTNFSYPDKQREVFALDWDNKLHYHIGCHVYDVNFKPWEWIEFLSDCENVSYVIKFVRTKVNAQFVDEFREYFIKNGISPNVIKVIFDMHDKAEDDSSIPPAYKHLEDISLSRC